MPESQAPCGKFLSYLTRIVLLIRGVYGGHSQCITSDYTQGNCVAIKDCPELFDIWEKPMINPDEMELLLSARCGTMGGEQKVCCAAIQTTTKNIISLERKLHSPDEVVSDLSFSDKCGLTMESKIFGGEYAGLGEFPWMALIEYSKPTGYGFHCGGALISEWHVLTAAHCVRDLRRGWRITSVRLGEHNLLNATDCDNMYCADPPENIAVFEIIPHEMYDPTNKHRYHDIAILKLVRPVHFTDYILPICFPPTHDSTYAGLNMTVAGWGKTIYSSQSDKLMKLIVPVKPQDECMSTYRAVKVELKEWQMCAGGVKGKDSCSGDSGGPLMLYNQTVTGPIYYITGIVSFGPTKCGSQGFPGVYTKVVDYIPWIKSKLKS
uniref:CLIP domain-containing serine protease n=1 Tax=Photinus pyralis TaxID=7054 RepID=A0A1Y1NHS8_PHOPY